MMSNLRLIFVLFFICNFSFGQGTKIIKKETKTPYYIKEVYEVLKKNESVKHGEYVRSGSNNRVVERGHYENNEKTGIWEFYAFDGALEQKYNFSENKIEWSEPEESSIPIQTEIGGKFTDIAPEEMPVFIGGPTRLQTLMWRDFEYPLAARRNGTQGTVLVSAVITKDGKVTNETVEVGIGSGCDDVALSAAQKIPDEWIPARVNGEATNVKIFYPLRFRLE